MVVRIDSIVRSPSSLRTISIAADIRPDWTRLTVFRNSSILASINLSNSLTCSADSNPALASLSTA